MLKSTISAEERDNYLNIRLASSRVGLSSYGLDACKELIGFRLDYEDKQLQPVFHEDDLKLFKGSVYHQVLSKIDLFTDYSYSSSHEAEIQPDEKLNAVINHAKEQHLLSLHKEATWNKFNYLSCTKDQDTLTYAQAAIYLGNIPFDELDELVFTGKLFSKRLTDPTGTYWLFKKSSCDDYLVGIKSESKLKKIVRLFKALRSK